MRWFRCKGLLFLLPVLLACGGGAPQLPPLAADAVVLAFGDSLTRGVGAPASASYPARLEQQIARRVSNAGISGEVSARGRARLPDVLDEAQPALLLLCHGGNDMLRRLNRGKLEDNLRAMLRLARERDVPVLLIGVPAPGPTPRVPDLYRKLAREFEVPYEGEVLAQVLSDASLKSDLVHPNARGYQKLADAVAALLEQSGAL